MSYAGISYHVVDGYSSVCIIREEMRRKYTTAEDDKEKVER